MIEQFGYWDALLWSALFALFVALAWLFLGTRKMRKAKPFLCGEEFEYSTPVNRFYSGFSESIQGFVNASTAYQSGSLNDYVSYAVVFISLVLLAVISTVIAGLV